MSGRISAIAVHPTNPSIVYVGAAQGGVYRSLDGGTTWTPLLDAAAKLSIGALAIDPQSASTLFVGTGEANLSGDSAAGVGIYIITNADGVSPALSGPFGAAAFNNRSISRIAINPGDHNTIFVTTTSGTVGNPGGSTGNFVAQPTRGLYRSQNALAATPSFTLLTTSSATNLSHTDVIINPANANVVICAAFGDGIYRSTNALDATPSF
ncbi:MAG TPA: hypothetical protein VEO95_06770, partial [Chthoniobacteraceae bacterium]|nr:hypothetical protein [Chthoniobacteraceae bacterium]